METIFLLNDAYYYSVRVVVEAFLVNKLNICKQICTVGSFQYRKIPSLIDEQPKH